MPKKRVLVISEAAKLIDGLTPFRVRQMCISRQPLARKAEAFVFDKKEKQGGDKTELPA